MIGFFACIRFIVFDFFVRIANDLDFIWIIRRDVFYYNGSIYGSFGLGERFFERMMIVKGSSEILDVFREGR
jgi:hypothetical protein